MSKNSNAARHLDIYYNTNAERYPDPKEQTRRTLQKRQLARRRREIRRRTGKKLLGITYVRVGLCVVIYAIVLTGICAKGSMMSYDVIRLENEIEKLEATNKQLAFEIQEKGSLSRIAEIASTQLGMVKPDMTNVYVADTIRPAQISMPDEEVEEKEPALDRLFASFKKFSSWVVRSSLELLASY